MASYSFHLTGLGSDLATESAELAGDAEAVAHAAKLLAAYRVALGVEIWRGDQRLATVPPFFVAVGASGGQGLRDIRDLLAALPADLPAVVLVVLHRPSEQVSSLREALGRASSLPVRIPEEADQFQTGVCYIGEPDAHLALARKSRVRLVEGANNRYRNRTVDLLFNSVAEHAGRRAIGVVLSGALDDGARGLAAISHAGGGAMVLTANGAVQPGMPQNAARYDGPIDFVGGAVAIARKIARRVKPAEVAPAA